MTNLSRVILALTLATASAAAAAAQENASGKSAIPKVLQITREFTKPYRGGLAHEKTESAFIQAMNKAKSPVYYLGMTSMSGKSRALFFTQYNSFADWEKMNKTVESDKTLSAELERASIADGDVLESVDSQVYTYDPELSYRPHADISDARYMEITVFQVKVGHRQDWVKAVKAAIEANEKGGTSSHWATFEAAYGVPDGTFIMLSSDKSLAEIDKGDDDYAKFSAAMGEEAMNKWHELIAATVDSVRSELFSFNPNMSYVNPAWIQAHPDFWKPKMPMSPKPAQEKEKAKP